MTEEHEQCDSLNSWELNGLNSLDLWDYTVELECLQGTEGTCCAKERGVAVALPAALVVARQFEAQKICQLKPWNLTFYLYTINIENFIS